jgi:hypothetical protein
MGPMEHLSIVKSKGFASIVFDVALSVGDRPPLPVRVSAVWKYEGKKWPLVQSSNTVAAEHQRADELLRAR